MTYLAHPTIVSLLLVRVLVLSLFLQSSSGACSFLHYFQTSHPRLLQQSLPPSGPDLSSSASTSRKAIHTFCGATAPLSPARMMTTQRNMVKDKTKDQFRDKTVLLTGASGGLGRSLALQLASCQVGTLLLSARNPEALYKVRNECREISPNTNYHVLFCDLADPNSVNELAQAALQKSPTIDCLINNGGVSSRSRFLDTTIDVDRQVMQINFLSGAALAKAFVPTMVDIGGGRIIWISSVQGLVGIPNRTSYAASKFAVQGYCESLRAELANWGITVHVVSPGYIRTNLSQSAMTGDGKPYGKMDPTTAQGADPDEVAQTVLDKVVSGNTDFTVAAPLSGLVAIWMKLLCPGILEKLLVKRYEKSQKEKGD